MECSTSLNRFLPAINLFNKKNGVLNRMAAPQHNNKLVLLLRLKILYNLGITELHNPCSTGPDALPWANAPQVCRATTKLVADATRGWHRTTHWLHHKQLREAGFAVVVVALRLDKKDVSAALALLEANAPPSGRQTRAAVAKEKKLHHCCGSNRDVVFGSTILHAVVVACGIIDTLTGERPKHIHTRRWLKLI